MARFIDCRDTLIRDFAPPGIWCELGVEEGNFAAEMLRTGNPSELWLIDCWGPYEGGAPRDPAFLDHARGEQIYHRVLKRFENDKRVLVWRKTIETALPNFPDNYFDFAYIDAGHSRAAVKRHLELAFRVVRSGGMIAGHDYWRTEGFPWIEVKPAVDEWCAEHGLEIMLISGEPCGSFAIIKP